MTPGNLDVEEQPGYVQEREQWKDTNYVNISLLYQLLAYS